MHIPEDYHRKQLWRQKYPTVIGALLSIFQMILTMAILGCEVGGIFVHFPRMNAFVGYATFPLLTCAWISLAGASCCCRIPCCGMATLVFQCLAVPMALCVIGVDAYFLMNPTQCYFSNDCSSYISTYSYHYYSYYTDGTYSDSLLNIDTLYNIKVPLIKGQLAAGVLMLVSCVIYFIIFGITSHRVGKEPQIYNNSSVPVFVAPVLNQYGPTSGSVPVNSLVAPPYNAHAAAPTNSILPSNQLTCHHCGLIFQIAT